MPKAKTVLGQEPGTIIFMSMLLAISYLPLEKILCRLPYPTGTGCFARDDEYILCFKGKIFCRARQSARQGIEGITNEVLDERIVPSIRR
jgi:hypothetical protein